MPPPYLSFEVRGSSLELFDGLLTTLLLQEQQDVVLHLTTKDLLGRLHTHIHIISPHV